MLILYWIDIGISLQSRLQHRYHIRSERVVSGQPYSSHHIMVLYPSRRSRRRAPLSSSLRLEFPSGPSSELSCRPWPSAAARLCPPPAEPCWPLSRPPTRCRQHSNVSQRHPGDRPAPSGARSSSYLRPLLINPVQPRLGLLHRQVPVLQGPCGGKDALHSHSGIQEKLF